MANIDRIEYEDMTDEELAAVRSKMDSDEGRTDETSDGDSAGYAAKFDEVR